jgi:uncharacterized protein YggE
MATIQVEGYGKATAAPDEIELLLTVSSSRLEYNLVMTDLDQKVCLLKDAFVACGVERSAIKTKDFRIFAEREYGEGGKQIFSGYQGTHEMLFCFPVDRKRLNALLAVCPGSEATPNIDIRFKMRNHNELQRQALESAFSAAKRNAELLAQSSDCELGALIEVLYGEQRSQNILTYRVNQDPDQIDYCRIDYAKEIEPEGIDCLEKVSVTWAISPLPTNLRNCERGIA